MHNAQRARALARERISTLIYVFDKRSPLDAEKKQLKQLLGKAEIDKNDPDLLALQSKGFLYTAEEFKTERDNFHRSHESDDVQGFIHYSLLKALREYLENHPEQTAYTSLYQQLSAAIENQDTQALKTLEPLLAKHQELAKKRQLNTRISFFHHAGLEIPEAIRDKAKEQYPHWNGKYPLHEVEQSAIRLDNIGISLDQLNIIMNQDSANIVLPGTPCDGRPNPFRQFTFNDAHGELYQVGSSFDVNHVFKVHAYKVDAHGKRKFVVHADFPGWMSSPVMDKELKDVTAAVSDALLTISDYCGAPQFNTAMTLRKESLNDLVDTLVRYSTYETVLDAMDKIDKETARGLEEDHRYEELFLYRKNHHKQHRIDKRRVENHLNSFIQFLIEQEGFDYQEVVHHLNKTDRIKLKEALEIVLRKSASRDLMLVGEGSGYIEGLLKSL